MPTAHASVPHVFFFADDALFFMKGTMDNCWNLKKTFDQFCKPLGEMVNLKVIHSFQQEHHSKVH